MYKWHVHSAIGRGRPATNDIARVADGIAASLRQFSISASRTADSEGSATPSRSQRSAAALSEVSSLSRGIDARSLAAKPPPSGAPGLKIIRRGQYGEVKKSPPVIQRGGGFRGGSRGGAMRGESGTRGRGGARGRGARGRGKGGKSGPRKPKEKNEMDRVLEYDQWTHHEAELLNLVEGGDPTPWEPRTSFEDLAAWMPPVGSTPEGLVKAAHFKMQVATGQKTEDYQTAYQYKKTLYHNGVGVMFESPEHALTMGNIGQLSEQEKEVFSKKWIAGQYDGPQPAKKGDILAEVAAYARRNETYIAGDETRLVESLRSRIPAQNAKPKAQPRTGA